MLTFADRADIAVGIESGLSDTEIAEKIDRARISKACVNIQRLLAPYQQIHC